MKSVNFIALAIFVVVLVAIFSLSPRASQKIQSTMLSVVSPFLSTGSEIRESADGFVKEVEDRETLEAENEELRSQVENLSARQIIAQDLKTQIETLEKELGVRTKYRQLKLVPARVISRNDSVWYQEVMINQGEDEGVALGDAVINGAGLVGKVAAVGKATAKVVLLTDEHCPVSVRALGTTSQGIVSGSRGASGRTPQLQMQFLDNSVALGEGTEIRTTGAGGVFPPNIPVGKVIKFKHGEVSAKATIEPLASFNSLDVVHVVRATGGAQAAR